MTHTSLDPPFSNLDNSFSISIHGSYFKVDKNILHVIQAFFTSIDYLR